MINPSEYAKQVDMVETVSKENCLLKAENERLVKVYQLAVAETVNAAQEIISLNHVISECEDNLKSMVEQYCRNGYFNENDDMSRNKYSHDFMSAGECTFEYLVARGLAEYLENGVDIRLIK